MIVREHANDFIMIEQDNHAHISGELIANWEESSFPGAKLRKSVEYAIFHHDCAWKPIDEQPFWNDQKQAPYTFIDFPAPAKLVFYKNGIDQVEQKDSYAGLLCSEHYKRFLANDISKAGQAFVNQENERQKRIITKLPSFDKQLFTIHYDLLQLSDNLSLYICLNEPGGKKENEHPFFRDGIPVSKKLNFLDHSKLTPKWKDPDTIILPGLPFEEPITIVLKQKLVEKGAIYSNGLIPSYVQAACQEIKLNLISDEK
ncbi:DUF3891 family protein [Lentibacillus sp. Marseille-P4043]|uniref:DUF3891 family protein n=1 Tax=Lentibacillus sp. Marseille-P4043 TaxID=2040293 RepID=UPI000D0B7C7B|nr:DUF3891 family protein [Lentibacillus sp. Marseille-P4043]